MEPAGPPTVATAAHPVAARPRRPPVPWRVLGLFIGGALVVALLVMGVRWWGAARADLAALDEWLDGREEAYRAVPDLTPTELGRLRRSLNATHVRLGQELGARPVARRAQLDSAAAARGLIRVASDSVRGIWEGAYSRPYLTPSAAAALDSIVIRFRAVAGGAGLPAFRFTVSSLWRSAEDQEALTRVNVNAARDRSSHEYATTFDLPYLRYTYAGPGRTAPPTPSADLPGFVRSFIRGVFQRRTAARFDRLIEEDPAPLAALLGRTLIALEDDGVVVALRETRQPVYHVTVARILVH